jgi:hypothetical protein
MSVETLISCLADGQRILVVTAGEVPAPPHAKHQGNHLFVNCLYDESTRQLSSGAILAAARADTLMVLRFLVANKMVKDIVSVVITFVAESRIRIPRRRLYRYSIFTSALAIDEEKIDASYFSPSHETIQSSEVEEIAVLLPTSPQPASA